MNSEKSEFMMNQLCGASLTTDGNCTWTVWAPKAEFVDLVLYDTLGAEHSTKRMHVQSDGFVRWEQKNIQPGQRYAFRLDGRDPRPDPASRWQPDGVHQPSAVWRAEDYNWKNSCGPVFTLQDLVIYELHPGTFTPEGTFAAIIPRLAELRELGITTIELMPVGQFPGQWGWGYDGVYWYAVQQSFGGPTELQRFVDACHSEGMSVILDVIYNHLGPEGNYLGEFAPYFSDRHKTPWGSAINFDGPSSRPVRDFVLNNVRQWVRDFRIDGLRLDAIHAMHDDSPVSILAEIKQAADDEAGRIGRRVHIIAESNLNDIRLLNPQSVGGDGLDAQWSDDFHHCVHTLLTGERDGYYADFQQPVPQLVKALNEFFVYDGCFSPHRKHNVGTPVGDHTGEKFVISIQTHDQVGNRAQGDRFGTMLSPEQQRLAAGLLLLAPNVPMLFMGEEYGETHPFPFFCDFGDERLRDAVRRGRREEFSSFGWSGDLPDPVARSTFESAVLSWNWQSDARQSGLRNLYRELLQLRRSQAAMHDFRNRQARLLQHASQADMLLLIRGNPSNPQECIEAVFNLSDVSGPGSVFEDRSGKLLLHSEESRFGGSIADSVPPSEMRPFSFAVFAPSGGTV